MLGLQTGHAIQKHTAHRMEGTKDDDSISGVSCQHGCLQRIGGAGMLAACHLLPNTGRDLQRIPLLLQTGRCFWHAQWASL